MASINLEKYTMKEIGGLGVHFDQSKRVTLKHSNEHINKELTKHNYTINTNSFQESKERMQQRTKDVDERIPPKRIKADRVVCDMCYIPCPHEIENKELFFQKSYEFLVDHIGSENVHGGFVHVDEVHEYRDSRIKDENDHQAIKISMQHMHVMISPYTAEKGINSKAFNSRERFRYLQKEFDLMVYKEFGIHYNTKDQALNLTVETLKEASSILHQKEKQINELQTQLDQANEKVKFAQQVNEQLNIKNSTVKLTEIEYFPTLEFKRKKFKNQIFNPFEKPKHYYEVSDVHKWIVQAKQVNKDNYTLKSENNALRAQNDELQALNAKALNVDALNENVELQYSNEILTRVVADKDNTIDYLKNKLNDIEQELYLTTKQLSETKDSLSWYQRIYTKLITFLDSLSMNNKSLLNIFKEKLPPVDSDQVDLHIKQEHDLIQEQKQLSHDYDMSL